MRQTLEGRVTFMSNCPLRELDRPTKKEYLKTPFAQSEQGYVISTVQGETDVIV